MKRRDRQSSRTYSIGAKIACVVGIVAAGYAASTGLAALQSHLLRQQLGELSSNAVPAALEAQAALFAFEEAVSAHNGAMLTGDAAELDVLKDRAAGALSLLDSVSNRQLTLHEDVALVQQTREAVASVPSSGADVFHAVAERGMNDASVAEELQTFRALVDRARADLTALQTAETDGVRSTLDGLVASTRKQVQLSLICFAVVIGFAIFVATWIVRRTIIRPVLGRAAELDEQASSISAAAAEFARSSQALAQGASQSAAALQNSSTALTQMANLTRANTDRAETTKQFANGARQAADSGSQRMQQLSSAMQAIQLSSQEISQIIKTIDEIAFQTNILALNAAVEAARAGTAGAGFAVVADEVRSLAQRSAEAARETAVKIEQATRRSNEGAQLSTAVVQHLTEIVQRVREVDELIVHIAQASHEQNTGIDQVTQSISELDQLTQTNAAMAEETSSSAQLLGEQTQQLRRVSQSFTRLARGSRRADADSSPSELSADVVIASVAPDRTAASRPLATT